MSRWVNHAGRHWVVAGFFLISLMVFLSGRHTNLDSPTSQRLQHANDDGDNGSGAADRPRYFRIVIPASNADAKLCKTIISQAVMGYSSPMLVNYKMEFNDPNLIFGGSHLAKINGVLDHLESLPPANDDDLVMIIDGYDVWVQLPPSVMLDRYHSINHRANRRIAAQFGGRSHTEGVSQRVIFSAQRKCWPKPPEHPACYAVPQSDLPDDVYGPQTDQLIHENKENIWLRQRQRFLNSGNAIGPVKDMRALFRRAKVKLDQDKGFGSDQSIFAGIFGEQEYYRHVLARDRRTYLARMQDWWSKKLGYQYSFKSIDPEASHGHQILEDVPDPLDFEFGIGLDYRMELQQATVFSEYDTDWIRYSDSASIMKSTGEKDIPSVRVTEIPEDIQRSVMPYQEETAHTISSHAWDNATLFTNMWTGVSPVAIHHNAHRDGLKSRIHTHWDKTWFFPQLRDMLDRRVLSAQGPLATTVDPASGRSTEWWPPVYNSIRSEVNSVRTTLQGEEWTPIQDLCAGDEIWKEVFRDGKGVWLDPSMREPRPPAVETVPAVETMPAVDIEPVVA